MFSNFSDAIKVRNKENIKSEFTFIGVKESSVEKYEKIRDDLYATVKFVAEVISFKKDKEIKNLNKIKLDNFTSFCGSVDFGFYSYYVNKIPENKINSFCNNYNVLK